MNAIFYFPLFQVSEIFNGSTDDVHPDGCQTIIETAHVLLAAGLHSGRTLQYYRAYDFKCIHRLLSPVVISYRKLKDESDLNNYIRQLKRIGEFFELLSLHGITKNQVRMYPSIMIEVWSLMNNQERVLRVTSREYEYNVIMDVWINMYRCLLLSGMPSIFKSEVFDNSCKGIQSNKGNTCLQIFILRFISIVGRSAACSRSMRLIHLIVNLLTVNEWRTLKNMVYTEQQAMTWETPDAERDEVNYTMQWIQGVQPRFNLERLTRHAILRHMSHRSLQDAASLGLPRHVTEYVLLQDAWTRKL